LPESIERGIEGGPLNYSTPTSTDPEVRKKGGEQENSAGDIVKVGEGKKDSCGSVGDFLLGGTKDTSLWEQSTEKRRGAMGGKNRSGSYSNRLQRL